MHRSLPEGSMYDYLTSCNAGRMDEVALNYFGKRLRTDKCRRRLMHVREH